MNRLHIFALVLVSLTGTTTLAADGLPAATDAPRVEKTLKAVDDAPAFTSEIARLTDDERRAMHGVAWRPGCPVPLDELRRVSVRHHDGHGGHPMGVLVVHRVIADDIVAVFADLYAQGFVVSQMVGIERYAGSDDDSMGANNTSAFNCREMAGRKGVFSLHAYGLALDVNPLVNPYVKGKRILPASGARYVDRTRHVPGMITRDDAVVRAFRARGFTWGGDFRSVTDWQHFEKQRSVLSSSSTDP